MEWQSVAKSWALRKEPPMLVGVKRLAIPVNDHPLEYMAFQDPQRKYYVKLWDHGTYSILNHSNTWILEILGSRLHGLFVLTPFKENFLFYRCHVTRVSKSLDRREFLNPSYKNLVVY